VSFMYEVYYSGPRDDERESRIRLIAEAHGGSCTYWEDDVHSPRITLTLEFETEEAAGRAMSETTAAGHYAEGPYLYG
jgi:hypothetical protein